VTAEINVFLVFIEKTVSDKAEADVKPSGRLFQSFVPTEARDRLFIYCDKTRWTCC